MQIATPVFMVGDKTKIKSATFEFPGDKWSLTVKGMTKDMSNMRDGRKRVAGLEDAEGTFDLKYDVANDPTVVANGNVRAGAVLDLELHVDETGDHFYGVSAIIDEITPSADFGDQNGGTLSVKWSLESGTVTYPDYTP
jgi:hypothetical protein